LWIAITTAIRKESLSTEHMSIMVTTRKRTTTTTVTGMTVRTVEAGIFHVSTIPSTPTVAAMTCLIVVMGVHSDSHWHLVTPTMAASATGTDSAASATGTDWAATGTDWAASAMGTDWVASAMDMDWAVTDMAMGWMVSDTARDMQEGCWETVLCTGPVARRFREALSRHAVFAQEEAFAVRGVEPGVTTAIQSA
jgi:hypothetical protein